MRLAATRSSMAVLMSGGDCAHTLVASAGSMIRARLRCWPKRRIAVCIVVSISARNGVGPWRAPTASRAYLIVRALPISSLHGGLKPPRPEWQGRGLFPRRPRIGTIMTATTASARDLVTAALLVIGDEILSGRTKDKNIGYIAEYLTAIGIDLREVRVVPDVEAEIVAAVNALRARYDHVLTTGGIGPTHDDITADAVAKAFGVPIDVDP